MARVAVVTDSSAIFENPHFPRDYHVSVVPNTVQIDGHTYLDGIEINEDDVLQRQRHSGVQVRVAGASVSQFEDIYNELTKNTNQIVVLVHSSKLSKAYANAQTARGGLLGRTDIIVIDSHTSSAALGYLVEEVALAADAGTSLDDLVRIARSTIQRLYTVYYVSNLDAITRAGLIGLTQSIVGRMLEIKPLLTIEDGALITMEKARTHSQAIEKMIEFVTEFTDISKLAITQYTQRITDETRMLQDRLALEFGHMNYPILLYDALMASYLGPDATGMVVLEGED